MNSNQQSAVSTQQNRVAQPPSAVREDIQPGILRALIEAFPRSMTVGDLTRVVMGCESRNTGVTEYIAKEAELRDVLNRMHSSRLIEGVRVHPPNAGYLPDVAITWKGWLLAIELAGEDFGDVSTHLLEAEAL